MKIEKLKELLSNPFQVVYFHLRGDWDEEDDERPGQMVRREAVLTLAMGMPDGGEWVSIGGALCAPTDQFSKEIGRNIAKGRMIMKSNTFSDRLPIDAYPSLAAMISNTVKQLPVYLERPLWYRKFLNVILQNIGHPQPPGVIVRGSGAAKDIEYDPRTDRYNCGGIIFAGDILRNLGKHFPEDEEFVVKREGKELTAKRLENR